MSHVSEHFAEYQPGAHGARDATLVVRAARPGDVAGIARVARTRGGEHVGLEGRLDAWVRDDERVVVVACRVAEPGRRAHDDRADGGQTDGHGTDGDPTDGHPTDGHRTDDDRTDGHRTDDDPTGGTADEVVGWSSAFRLGGHDDAPDGWYVSSLTVDPAWRRRGAGDRLLAAVIVATETRSAVLRSIVNATNRASLDLHTTHGFVEEARGSSFAGITFQGGAGVLLRRDRAGT